MAGTLAPARAILLSCSDNVRRRVVVLSSARSLGPLLGRATAGSSPDFDEEISVSESVYQYECGE